MILVQQPPRRNPLKRQKLAGFGLHPPDIDPVLDSNGPSSSDTPITNVSLSDMVKTSQHDENCVGCQIGFGTNTIKSIQGSDQVDADTKEKLARLYSLLVDSIGDCHSSQIWKLMEERYRKDFIEDCEDPHQPWSAAQIERHCRSHACIYPVIVMLDVRELQEAQDALKGIMFVKGKNGSDEVALNKDHFEGWMRAMDKKHTILARVGKEKQQGQFA
jgi:hypothetical protein